MSNGIVRRSRLREVPDDPPRHEDRSTGPKDQRRRIQVAMPPTPYPEDTRWAYQSPFAGDGDPETKLAMPTAIPPSGWPGQLIRARLSLIRRHRDMSRRALIGRVAPRASDRAGRLRCQSRLRHANPGAVELGSAKEPIAIGIKGELTFLLHHDRRACDGRCDAAGSRLISGI